MTILSVSLNTLLQNTQQSAHLKKNSNSEKQLTMAHLLIFTDSCKYISIYKPCDDF